ncbi:MAG: HAD hydrolase family protein [Candidatus Lokiarchaeota archaeon]|nr:HAD hydrolase family protein [Candidatus Lokiarchaeota archaeon]
MKLIVMPPRLIKAAIIDIDGCPTSKQFGQALDLDSLREISEISKKYMTDPAIPMIVLNTGRDLNHTELMAKILDAFHYFIIEAGAALVSVHGAQISYKFHPSITTESLRKFDTLQVGFLNACPQYRKYLQHGKRYMITFLFDVGDATKEKCAVDLKNYIGKDNPFVVDEGHNFINITFPGVNKGSGLELLLQSNTEFTRENIAGIGDSTGDWDFLKMCAFSACPSNGSDFLQDHCNYIASGSEARGTLEILQYIIERNRHAVVQRQSSQKSPRFPIKAVITDINGTIDSAVFGKSLPLVEIGRIRDLMARSRKDPAIPRIFFNTGWDLNYTLLYAQLLDIPQYHIIERGAAIVSIDGPFVHEKIDPRITLEIIEQMASLSAGFISKHPRYYRHLQVGKKYTISFQFEIGSAEFHACLDDMRNYLHDNNVELDIEEGPNFINIGVPGIDKGTGTAMLVEMLPGIKFENIAGIGDSDGDWSYMQRCGFSACPSNASRFLREHCDYVATKPETEGTLEILEKIIQWNIDF